MASPSVTSLFPASRVPTSSGQWKPSRRRLPIAQASIPQGMHFITVLDRNASDSVHPVSDIDRTLVHFGTAGRWAWVFVFLAMCTRHAFRPSRFPSHLIGRARPSWLQAIHQAVLGSSARQFSRLIANSPSRDRFVVDDALVEWNRKHITRHLEDGMTPLRGALLQTARGIGFTKSCPQHLVLIAGLHYPDPSDGQASWGGSFRRSQLVLRRSGDPSVSMSCRSQRPRPCAQPVTSNSERR